MDECKMLYLYNGILASRRVWNNKDGGTDDFLNFFLSNRRQSQGKYPLHISGVYSHTYVEKAEQWLAGTWREGLDFRRQQGGADENVLELIEVLVGPLDNCI